MAIKTVKKGDNVTMLTGKDKGRTGTVLNIRKDGRIVVAKLNLIKKHSRPRRQGEKGQIIEKPCAVHPSNVMLICPNCKKASRVGWRLEGDKKVRFCKKCQAIID